MTLPDGVTEKDVKRYSKLAGVVKALNKLHGHGKWGDTEVATYIAQSKDRKLKALETAPSRTIPSWLPPETFQKRLDEYLSAFDRITPNDRQSFATLVTIELNLEHIRERLLTDLEASDYQKLSDSLTTLSREHRQLQESLGVGRARRKSEASAQDEIEKLRAGAARFLDRQTTKIECRACRTQINMGFVAFHFRDEVPWRMEALCPKCGKLMVMHGAIELPAPQPPTIHRITDGR